MGAAARKFEPNVQRDMAKELAAARALKDQLFAIVQSEESDATSLNDAVLARDMIEGETGLFEAVDKVLEQIALDQTRIEGIKKFKTTLDARAHRLDTRIETLRAMLTNTLDLIEQRRLERPLATVTLKAVPPKLGEVREAEVPSAYWRQPEPELDKQKLTDALKQRRAAIDQIHADEQAAVKAEQPLDATAQARHAALLAACPPIPGAELTNGSVTVQIRFG